MEKLVMLKGRKEDERSGKDRRKKQGNKKIEGR
jgi:hypothetical protein